MDGPFIFLILTIAVSIAYAIMPFVIFRRLKRMEKLLEQLVLLTNRDFR